MGSNFIVKVSNPRAGGGWAERLFDNLVDAIEFKNQEISYGYSAKVYRFVEFNEVPGGVK